MENPIVLFHKSIQAAVPPTKELLGGKGYGLSVMSDMGIPVPPGFTITTEVCNAYFEAEDTEAFMDTLMVDVNKSFEWLVGIHGHTPLVSVRSGARQSMPGMMDTILNVGMTWGNVDLFAVSMGERAAYDSLRRLMQMFGTVVLDYKHEEFEEILESVTDMYSVPSEADLPANGIKVLAEQYRQYMESKGSAVPNDPIIQLRMAIEAVFKSWNNPRAIHYRKMNGFPDSWGTAVNVQTMVFGNLNDQSCSGVMFTRNPATGECTHVGEFLPNAQGEDVVAGIRTPKNLSEMIEWNKKVYDELIQTAERLEAHAQDMQDIEFTVENGELYILQTRSGKRTAIAAFNIASDMVDGGMIDIDQARSRITKRQYYLLKERSVVSDETPVAMGIPAGGGAASGRIAFTSEKALEYKNSGENVILVRKETSPDDIVGMEAAVGILTSTGGATSHAAVVARSLDTPCVVGLGQMKVDYDKGRITLNGSYASEGDKITINGSTGDVWLKEMPVTEGELPMSAKKLLSTIADKEGLVSEGPDTAGLTQDVYLNVRRYEMRPGDLLKVLEVLTDSASSVTVELSTSFDEKDSPAAKFFALMAVSKGEIENQYYKVIKSLPKKARDKIKVVSYVSLKPYDLLKGGVFPASTRKALVSLMGSEEALDLFLGAIKSKASVKFIEGSASMDELAHRFLA